MSTGQRESAATPDAAAAGSWEVLELPADPDVARNAAWVAANASGLCEDIMAIRALERAARHPREVRNLVIGPAAHRPQRA